MNRITDLLNSTYGTAPPVIINSRCVALDDSANRDVAPTTKICAVIILKALDRPSHSFDGPTPVMALCAAFLHGRIFVP